MHSRSAWFGACAFASLGGTHPAAVAQVPSQASVQMVDWIIRSSDNRGLPFMVIDKAGGELFVFDRTGVLMGRTPALIGSARGDYSVLGVGDRELSDIKPRQRTTPAGRFVARIGPSLGLGRVLWVDIPGAVALHPVINNKPREHRLERLRSPTPRDNRITYGCINISPRFYRNVVRTLFTERGGVVYILPETRPLAATFPAFRAHQSRVSKRRVRTS